LLLVVIVSIIILGKWIFSEYIAGFGLLIVILILYLIADKSYKDAHYELMYKKTKNPPKKG